jgi:ribose transport system permease protein
MVSNKFAFFRQYGIAVVLIVLIIFFSVATDSFLRTENLWNVTRQVAMLGISAVGMSCVILTAGIDLSVGSLMSLTNIFCATLMVRAGIHPVISVVLTLILAVFVGFVNGVFINEFDVPPLITTLGMMTSLRGLSYVLCGGMPIFGFPDHFRILGQGYIGKIPIPVIIMLCIFILGWIFLNKVRYGRYIYGLGGNEEAARLSGINVKHMKYMVYMLSAFLTGIASIIMLSRINTGQPKIGTGFEMQVITAVVLGGVSIFGGQGKLFSVFLGVLIMGVLANGMILMNVSEYYQMVTRGAVLLTAVVFDNLSKRDRNT